MSIFIRELRANLKGLFIWSAIMIAFCAMAFTEAQAFIEVDSVEEMMAAFPDELMRMFSMDSFDISTPEGYFGLLATYFALALTIYSVMRACTSIVSEERDKTVEFSLVLPIRRHRLLTAKLLVVQIYGMLINLVTIGCGLVFGLIVEASEIYYEFVWLTGFAVFFMQLLYMAIGFCIGCLFRNHKRANSLGLAILLSTYFFSVFSEMHEDLEFLKYITPFKFFDFVKILEESALSLNYILITVGLSAVLIAVGYIGYGRRDMQI